MAARANSTHGGFVSGEWWITSDGEVWFADQDIGEQGHEAIALDFMVDKEVLVEGLLDENIISEEEAKEFMDDDVTSMYIIQDVSIPDEVGKRAFGSDVWDTIKKRGIREAFMKHHGAIMVLGNSFYSQYVTDKTLDSIRGFLEEQFEGEVPPGLEVTIERMEPTRKYVFLDWKDLAFAKPSELEWWG